MMAPAHVERNRTGPSRGGRASRGRILLTLLLSVGFATASAQTVPTSGLLGYWQGDGNANDSSSYANNGSFSGTYGLGISGQAFQTSVSDYVSSPDAAQYTITGDFSVGFWFKGGVGGAFVGQDNGGGGIPKWFVDYGYINAGVFNLHLNGPGGFTVLSSNAVSPSGTDWHSFALVRSGTSFSFFLDGASIGSPTSSYILADPSAPFTIGFSESAAGSFTGLMDEIVFYNRALSGGEVAQLAAIPEPSVSALAIGLGIFGLARWRRRRISPPRDLMRETPKPK